MNTAAIQSDAPVTSPDAQTQPVVVYDGTCKFCIRQTERLKNRDRDRVFEFVPRQREGLERRFPALASEDFNTGLRLIHPDGKIDVGADAVYQISRRLHGYRRLAWLYRVPLLGMFFRAAYAQVAKNRYRLAGQTTCDDDGACRIDGA